MRFLIIPILISSIISCSTTTQNTTKSNKVETVEAIPKDLTEIKSIVLNPNLASADQMKSLAEVDGELANSIISRRPFLKSMEFLEFIKSSLDSAQFLSLKENLYVPMNLNTAAESDFMNVPGVGKKMAHEFGEYRPYKSIEQFKREIGKYVDEKEVNRYLQYVFVPINLNTASKEEILGIPGVGEKMANEFEEYRPYQEIIQFEREMKKYISDKEVARLKRFVTL